MTWLKLNDIINFYLIFHELTYCNFLTPNYKTLCIYQSVDVVLAWGTASRNDRRVRQTLNNMFSNYWMKEGKVKYFFYQGSRIWYSRFFVWTCVKDKVYLSKLIVSRMSFRKFWNLLERKSLSRRTHVILNNLRRPYHRSINIIDQ